MFDQKIASYTGLRKDVISMIEGAPSAVLDVGCSNGVLIDYLKTCFGLKYAAGIEFDYAFAKEASEKADTVFNSDLDGFDWSLLQWQSFDLIICADVLEHTKEPAEVLRNALRFASKDAQIIISLPNVQHWTAIGNLLRGKWPQRDRGLFDRTHLRFFTLASIYHLADDCGLTIDSVLRKYRVFDRPGGKINRFSRMLAFPPFKSFVTYQYVVSMRLV